MKTSIKLAKNNKAKPLLDRKKAQPILTTQKSKSNLFLPTDPDSQKDDFSDWKGHSAGSGTGNNDYLYIGKQDNHLVADSIVSSSQGVLVTKIMEFFKFHCIFYNQRVRLRDIEALLHDPSVITVTKHLPSSTSTGSPDNSRKTPTTLKEEKRNIKNINYSSNTQIAARENKLQLFMLQFNKLFVVSHLKPVKWFESISFSEGLEEGQERKKSVSRFEFIRELRTLCDTVHLPQWDDNDARILFDFLKNPVCGNNHFASLFLTDNKKERRMHLIQFKNAIKIFNLSTKKVRSLNKISGVVLRLGEHALSYGLKLGLLIGDRTLNSDSMISKETLSNMVSALINDFTRKSKNNAAKNWLEMKCESLKDAELCSVISENSVSSRSSFEDIDSFSITSSIEPSRRRSTSHIATSAKAPTVASMQRELSSEIHFHPVYGHAREVSLGKASHAHGGVNPFHHEMAPVPEESGADSASVMSQVTTDSIALVSCMKPSNKTAVMQHLQRSSTLKGKSRPCSGGTDISHIEYIRNKFRAREDQKQVEAHLMDYEEKYSKIFEMYSDFDLVYDDMEYVRESVQSAPPPTILHQHQRSMSFAARASAHGNSYGYGNGNSNSSVLAATMAASSPLQQQLLNRYSSPVNDADSIASSIGTLSSDLKSLSMSMSMSMSLAGGSLTSSKKPAVVTTFKKMKRGTTGFYYQSLLDKFDHSINVVQKQMTTF